MFKPRKTFKNRLIAVAVAGAATLMVAAPAQAYVMASSVLNMTQFEILGTFDVVDADGNVTGQETRRLNVSDFQGVTFTGTADAGVSLTGFPSDSYSAANPPTNPIDSPALCIGNACDVIIDNDFPKLFAPPATGNYSAADQNELGAPISGLPGFSDPADVANAAYVGIDIGTADASGTSNNNLNSSFAFVLDQDAGITFSFLLDAFLQVAVTGDEIFPGFATASYSMEFSIVNQNDGSNVLNFAPDAFGDGTKTLSLNAPTFLGVDREFIRDTVNPTLFTSTTAALTAGTPYQASFRMTTEADAGRQQIPEPATLALLGMGLMGLGLVARRRKHVG